MSYTFIYKLDNSKEIENMDSSRPAVGFDSDQIPIANPVLLHCISLTNYLRSANEIRPLVMQTGDRSCIPNELMHLPKCNFFETLPSLSKTNTTGRTRTRSTLSPQHSTISASNKSNFSSPSPPTTIEPSTLIMSPKLTTNSVHLLIKRAIVLLLASLDVNTTTELSVDLIGDLLIDFLQRITRLMKLHTDTSNLKTFTIGSNRIDVVNVSTEGSSFLASDSSKSELFVGDSIRPFTGDIPFKIVEKTLQDAGYGLLSLQNFEKEQTAYRNHLWSQAVLIRKQMLTRCGLSVEESSDATSG